MGLNFYIYNMENKSICQNPWCKATYSYEGEFAPGQCNKCISFNSELSDGVTWTTKVYNEPRNDNRPHPISINVNGSPVKKIGESLQNFIINLFKTK